MAGSVVPLAYIRTWHHLFTRVRRRENLVTSPGRGTRGAKAQGKGPGLKSRPSVLPLKRLSLGVDSYLAVDLLDQGLAVLVPLLVLADLPELLGGKVLQPLGDLRNGQLVVVGGLQRTEDGGA